MGVIQSSLPTEAAAVGALVAGTVTAYTVYRRVADVDSSAGGKNAEANLPSSISASSSTTTTTATAAATSSNKKNKGKKRKDVNAAGAKSERDVDAELEEVLADAKARERTRLEEEARAKRETAGKSLIPGAFDQDGAGTAQSSEAEGRKEKKPKKKGKKAAPAGGASASGAGAGAATPSSDKLREGDNKEASPSGSKKLDEAHAPATVQAAPSADPTGPSKKQKKRKGGKAADSQAAFTTAGSASNAQAAAGKPSSSMSSSQALAMSVTMSDAPEDVSWTRVSTRKKAHTQEQSEAAQTEPELLTSDTNLTTSGVTDPENTEEDEGSAQEPEKRRTFAERMLPRPRKTGVEDMEDEPLQPTLARVMRVKPAVGEKPAKGFTWADYEEYAQAEDGTSADGDADDAWEQVKSKKKPKPDRSTSGISSSADSLPPQTQQTQTQTQATTKRQRQNAERRDAAKSEKDAQERERLERLAQHQRELERVRIAEQYAKGSGGKKNVSGGMKAAVGESGKLVWE